MADMIGPFQTGPRKRRPTITITPLIDVMLLLLIFFMLTSTFRQSTGLDITLPQARSGSAQEMELHEVGVDREGQLFFGTTPVDEAGLRQQLTELLAEEPGAQLILRADASADFGRVIRAIDIAREVGGEQLIIPTDLPVDLPEESTATP